MPGKKPALLGQGQRREQAEEIPLSDADLAALDELCSAVAWDEIELDTWQRSHERLDLCIPLKIAPEIAEVGGEVELGYSRTVTQTATPAPVREKRRVTVKIPAGTRSGARIRLAGQGDLAGTMAGDLEVVIRIVSAFPETTA